MRSWLTIVSLVVVLAIVGFLMNKQMAAVRATPPALTAPLPATGLTGPAPSSVQPASQPRPSVAPSPIQQQYKQAIESAIQQPRPMPDDVK